MDQNADPLSRITDLLSDGAIAQPPSRQHDNAGMKTIDRVIPLPLHTEQLLLFMRPKRAYDNPVHVESPRGRRSKVTHVETLLFKPLPRSCVTFEQHPSYGRETSQLETALGPSRRSTSLGIEQRRVMTRRLGKYGPSTRLETLPQRHSITRIASRRVLRPWAIEPA